MGRLGLVNFLAMAATAAVAVVAGCGTQPPPVTFVDDLLSFDHPAGWQVAVFPATHRLRPIAYLSTQAMTDPCERTANSVSCEGRAVDSLAPNGRLVSWVEVMPPPGVDADTSGGRILIGGKLAYVATPADNPCQTIDADRTVLVTIPHADHGWIQMEACIRGPDIVILEGQVNAMLDSVEWQPRPAQTEVILLTHVVTEFGLGGPRLGVVGGQINEVGKCLFLDIGTRRSLVVWPPGTTLDASTTPAVVRNAVGKRIVALGEVFSMGGRRYEPDEVESIAPLLDDEIPASCLGHEILLADPHTRPLTAVPTIWRVDETTALTADSTSINVRFKEHWPSCLDPYPRLQMPRVEYQPEGIVITLPILEITSRCMKHPEHPLTVLLQEPIGHRSLIDGSSGAVVWRDGTVIPPTPE